MAYVALGNPIWSCQYRLHGGRRIFVKAGVAGLVAVGLIILYHRTAGRGNTVGATAAEALRVLAWVQVAVLVLGGTGAVTRALLRDYTTKMIEAYRISPMSSVTVVLGYLFGNTMQILLLFGAGVIIGWALTFLTGRGSGEWLVGNFFLLVASVSIWSLAVFAGVGSGKPRNLIALIIIASFSSSVVMGLAPGLGLFTGIYALGRCQRYMLGVLGSASGFGVALAASVLMLAYWSIAAARRYRKPYLPPLSTPAALVLVALWLSLFVVGMSAHEDLIPSGGLVREMAEDAPDVALMAALLSPLLVAHLPAAAAVHMRRRHILGAEPSRRGDRWSPGLASGLSVLLIVAMLAAVTALDSLDSAASGGIRELSRESRGAVVVALVLAVWTVTGLLRLSQYTIGRSIMASAAVALLWTLPPVIDHIRVFLTYGPYYETGQYSFLVGSSPVFSILAACLSLAYVFWPGLLVQLGIAVVATLLANRAERILIRKRARLRAEEAQTDARSAPPQVN